MSSVRPHPLSDVGLPQHHVRVCRVAKAVPLRSLLQHRASPAPPARDRAWRPQWSLHPPWPWSWPPRTRCRTPPSPPPHRASLAPPARDRARRSPWPPRFPSPPRRAAAAALQPRDNALHANVAATLESTAASSKPPGWSGWCSLLSPPAAACPRCCQRATAGPAPARAASADRSMPARPEGPGAYGESERELRRPEFSAHMMHAGKRGSRLSATERTPGTPPKHARKYRMCICIYIYIYQRDSFTASARAICVQLHCRLHRHPGFLGCRPRRHRERERETAHPYLA